LDYAALLLLLLLLAVDWVGPFQMKVWTTAAAAVSRRGHNSSWVCLHLLSAGYVTQQ
jgi:hypothetical protein